MTERLLNWTVGSLIRWLGLPTILSFTLLVVALGSVAWALSDVIQGPDLDLLLAVAFGGLWLGWLMAAARPIPGWLAGLVIGIVGVEATLLHFGQFAGTLTTIAYALTGLTGQLWRWPLTGPPDATPLIASVTELWLGLATILVRFYSWSLALATGKPIFDPVVITLVWCLALGSVAAWSAWGIRRWEHPLLALAPAGALLGTTLAYALRQIGALLPLIGATLLLIGLVGHYTRERRWQAAGIDFALDIRVELSMAIAAISLSLVAVAAVTPSISINAIVRPMQAYFRAETVNESFGLRRPPDSNTLPDPLRAPGLPRQHLLGSGPELSEKVVLLIKTNDPRPQAVKTNHPGPVYYWRSLTYDRYTGRGWITTRAKPLAYEAGEAAIPADTPGRHLLRQEVQVIAPQNDLIYAAGELITADHDYNVIWRTPGDAFAATVNSTIYRADSAIPALSEQDLRAAGNEYPDWVQQRYLSLNPKIPDRVLSLALNLTATAPTPYDRAKAIESYLRTFPYSLDLPEPPFKRDLVDYFLFDLQQGYCDYYATSMVVLARAAGLPARLAVGYVGGSYDETTGHYVVTEAEAHSWVELYFPEYGWVNFEPTGGRPALERPAEGQFFPPPILSPLSRPGTESGNTVLWWGQGLLAGLTLLLVVAFGWWAIDGWRLRQAAPATAAAILYRRLYKHGQRLASPTTTGHTPHEFAAALTEQLNSLASTSRLRAVLTPAPQEIYRLTELYVQSLYSPHPPDRTTQIQAIRIWRLLRRRLWLAWFYFGSRRGPAAE